MTKPRRRTHARILAELDAELAPIPVPRFAEPGRTWAHLAARWEMNRERPRAAAADAPTALCKYNGVDVEEA